MNNRFSKSIFMRLTEVKFTISGKIIHVTNYVVQFSWYKVLFTFKLTVI